jgi:hypothetical protein
LSESSIRTTTASTGGVLLAVTVASAEGQTKEGAHETPTREVARSGMAATPWAKAAVPGADQSQPGTTATLQVQTAQMGPSLVQTEMAAPVTDMAQPDTTASLSMGLGQLGKNATKASSVIVVMGWTIASTSSALPTTKGPIPEEVVPMEGSAPLGVNAASSWALVHVGGDLHMSEGPALRHV